MIKLVGTLNEFVDLTIKPPSSRGEGKNIPFSPKKGDRFYAKSSLDQHESRRKFGSKRSMRTEEPPKIEQKLESLKGKSSQLRQAGGRYSPKRQSYNFSIFNKKSYMISFHTKMRPKMEQSMLRAQEIVQKPKPAQQPLSKHEQFYSKGTTFSRVKLAPFEFGEARDVRLGSHERYFSKSSRRRNASISSEKRIEYQHCLSWARRHCKDTKYYEAELGKVKPLETWKQQWTKRKSLLQKVKEISPDKQRSKTEGKVPLQRQNSLA